MSQGKKLKFNFGKNKLFCLLRNGLRILFLLIFLHWIFWFTTYAKNTSYYEAIKDEKIDQHDKKTDKYNNNGLLGTKREERNIAEIEEDILEQIEKKKGLNKNDIIRSWKHEKLTNLRELDNRIKELEEKNTNQDKKKELEEKRKNYQEELEKAKNDTIKNIQGQLEKNGLNITELDDDRNLFRRMTYDPLKFFLISPLNKISKTLGLNIILEIIFKSLVIEILLVLMCYSETITVWENMEKINNESYLSEEEKEKLNAETSSLVKYLFFNGFMMFFFGFCVFIHPAHFDRNSSWFQTASSGTRWYIWILPFFISIFLSNISTEFLRYGRLLNKKELKNYIVKNLVINLLFTLLLFFAIWKAGMNSRGGYLFSTLGGLVRFTINTIRVKFFGHREYSLIMKKNPSTK